MLETQKDAAHIDVHDLVKHLDGVVHQRQNVALPSSIVHEDIDAAPGLHGGGHIGLDLRLLADIGFDTQGLTTPFLQQRLSLQTRHFGQVHQQHLGAHLAQGQRHSASDTATGSGDHGHLPTEVDLHLDPSF